MQRIIALLTLALALAFSGGTAFADEKTDKKLEDCRKVFESFTDLSEQSVPTWMLERAYGIVVIPQVIKGAVIFGGRGGRGCMAVRNTDGSWSNPVFVTLAGGSWGFQFGVQSSDVVLVLMSRQSVEGISGGKVTLGADASVAAGPARAQRVREHGRDVQGAGAVVLAQRRDVLRRCTRRQRHLRGREVRLERVRPG